jgi:S-adenosylmethionine:tRNA ribosyltransferase-isomerase
MIPATWPRDAPRHERLLHLDPSTGRIDDLRLEQLPERLRAGDLLVVNDAATLPASLRGATASGEAIEIRLAGRRLEAPEAEWTAVLFGAGDWTMRTEDRPAPPRLEAGDVLSFGSDLRAIVRQVSPVSPRLLEVAFEPGADAFWPALYRHARPIQYSYLRGALALWHVQTGYGARPWAVEPPSAGRPLTWERLDALRARGIARATITHAAGLSSTGDPAIDVWLPFPERFDVPSATVRAVSHARRWGGRVIAVGTTVVRALESAAALHRGRLRPHTGVTNLRIGPGFGPRVVDGLLTGMHEPDTSHFALLAAFAPPESLAAAHRHAEAEGYLCHEFGDSMLIVSSVD